MGYHFRLVFSTAFLYNLTYIYALLVLALQSQIQAIRSQTEDLRGRAASLSSEVADKERKLAARVKELANQEAALDAQRTAMHVFEENAQKARASEAEAAAQFQELQVR
jgi:uncharacterized protein YoxC